MPMEQERDPRITKAFITMKSIGISTEVVKPVLKRLLRLYDRNWELIEDDNYRTLADAIFEYGNKKMVEKSDTTMKGVVEPPFKKPHQVLPEDQNSSTVDNCSRIIDLEEDEIPERDTAQKMTEASQSFRRNPRGEPCSLACPLSVRYRGKSPVLMAYYVIMVNDSMKMSLTPS